jgi:hypothetical protein
LSGHSFDTASVSTHLLLPTFDDHLFCFEVSKCYPPFPFPLSPFRWKKKIILKGGKNTITEMKCVY